MSTEPQPQPFLQFLKVKCTYIGMHRSQQYKFDKWICHPCNLLITIMHFHHWGRFRHLPSQSLSTGNNCSDFIIIFFIPQIFGGGGGAVLELTKIFLCPVSELYSQFPKTRTGLSAETMHPHPLVSANGWMCYPPQVKSWHYCTEVFRAIAIKLKKSLFQGIRDSRGDI